MRAKFGRVQERPPGPPFVPFAASIEECDMRKLPEKQKAYQLRRKERLNKRRLRSKTKQSEAKLRQIAGEET